FQRPMSQNNRALDIIEKETGMESKVLRPLSAKHLPPTEAEKRGLIKRENMGDIKGRSRKGQLALARHFEISDPPNAAGGCLLTDPSFSKRVKDIIDHSSDVPTLNDIELLKVGRHFRIKNDAKLVVGRNKDENEVIKALATDGDIIIEVKDYVGPTCILRCKNHDHSLLKTCGAIAARYSDAPKQEASLVSIIFKGCRDEMTVTPADIGTMETLRI
ncbi:MAG: tRNA (5-methylaminomethyl-2-thiouridylate)-methyltransferase, partial [Thermoproteota archaeon]|nr:tRNA (5-methylaminomethyl-2-thiouridylate)-methyltransferase [Thermoproteota archaeon]